LEADKTLGKIGGKPPHSKSSWRNGLREIVLDVILRCAQDDGKGDFVLRLTA
jgi:hypothetical protein